MNEVWRAIPGYETSYEVSDLGRVRSLDRISAQGRPLKGVILVQATGSDGYKQVNLYREGRPMTCLVHRLVMLAFVGSAPEGMEVRHLNGARFDNVLTNLTYGTHLDNMRDQRRHGTHRNSVKTHCPSGHPYAGGNLLVEKNGNRRCAICRRDSWRRVTARRTAAKKTERRDA